MELTSGEGLQVKKWDCYQKTELLVLEAWFSSGNKLKRMSLAQEIELTSMRIGSDPLMCRGDGVKGTVSRDNLYSIFFHRSHSSCLTRGTL
jgi:hypothetical protein